MTVVLLHGFTQTGRSWDGLASALAGGHRVTQPDLPGHGDRPDGALDLWQAAASVGRAAGPGAYLGYSLGGRVALHLALSQPDLVHRLVLVSTTAGIDDVDERARRRAADHALADALERDGLEPFLDRWLALPLFAGLPADASGRQDRLRNTATGLAASLRHAGTGTMDPPLWDRLGELEMPVLVVAGRHDPKFLALGERLAAGITGARLVVVADAGHAVHLEQPRAFVAAVEPFLALP